LSIETLELISEIAAGGQYAYFNGVDGYINIPDNILFTFGDGSDDSPFSISAWIRIEEVHSRMTIISKYGNTTNTREWVFTQLVGDYLEFFLFDESVGFIKVTSTGTLIEYFNKWIHVTATYDGGSDKAGMELYINGSIVASDKVESGTYVAMNNFSTNVLIGQQGGSSFFNGKMNNVKVFDVELSSAQVEENYLTGLSSDLVAHYILFVDADDSSNNALNGVNNNVDFPNFSLMGLNSGVETGISLESEIAAGSKGYGIFNGTSSYVLVPDSNLLSFGDGADDSAFTLMSWINMDDATSFPILSKGTGQSDDEYALYLLGNDVIQFLLWDQSANAFIGRRGVALSAYESTWLHVAVTYDGSKSADGIVIYVNGVVNDISDVNNGSYVAMENSSSDLFIGHFSIASSFADGKMKDIKIFDAELSDAEILVEYGANSRTADLVAHYRLNGDVDDSGSNSLDGANYGATLKSDFSKLELESSLL